jgi:hypothetical protein
MASKLGLHPQDYESSDLLREWAKRNMKEKYVPVHLLATWGLAEPEDMITDTSDSEQI